MTLQKLILSAVVVVFQTSFLFAQGAEVAFGGLQLDVSLPVEISADQLKIDQNDGTATFTGNVLIGQGEMRLSAGLVFVQYSAGDGQATGQISRLLASGGVTLVNGNEAAEAQKAEYSIDAGTIVMSGGVILTQGANALAADTMVVDLNTGRATLDGRVRTVFQTGGN